MVSRINHKHSLPHFPYIANREKRLRMLRNNRVASASTAPKSKALSSASSDSQGKSLISVYRRISFITD